MPIKLFIVDDHYMVIEGINSLLQNEKNIEWMGHAGNAASCLSFIQNQKPDVILMDINLPDKSGIDLCREVKEKYPGIYIIGLSTFNQQSFIEKMMASGASGYLLKNATQQELMDGIEAVIKGKQYLSFDAAIAIRKSDTENQIPVITRREKEVLELIADGMTNNEIAQKLFIGVSTVDTHRKNLLSKFDARNIAALIKIVMQLNIIGSN
jgi:DNA-binding NarL/FixJ family response regulator